MRWPALRVVLFLLVALTALVVAACSDGGDDDEVDAAPTAAATTTQASASAPPEIELEEGTTRVVADAAVADPEDGLFLPDDESPFEAGRIFNDNSPFNRPIAPDAPLHPESDAFVAALLERAKEGVVLASTEWTIPAYLARAETPRVDVRLTAAWSPFERLLSVPIPDGAQPDPQDDGHLTLIDREGGWVYDLWQARLTKDGWEASWGNRISLASTGLYPTGMSARGSGFSSLAGLIWPHELAQGRIDHALIFSTLPNRAGVFVAPATESDGRPGDPSTLPEGARLQLDPTLDLESLALDPWQRTIAQALQEYGMILADNASASVLFYLVNAQSFGDLTLPYEIEEGIGLLEAFPIERLRLLDYEEIVLDDNIVIVADESIYADPREVE